MSGHGLRLVALIPEVAEGEGLTVCRELGVDWQPVRSVGGFLAAIAERHTDFALLSFASDAVDEALAQRVLEALAPGGGQLLLSSPQASLARAVAALRLGAGTLLSEPLASAELGNELRSRIDPGDLLAIPPAEGDTGVPALAGSGPAMMEVVRAVARLGATPAPVLITGESGTGKELVARAIHWASPRRTGAFVAINCAAVPESLLESEFFGHERGAFTGAVTRRQGRFERADGGTLFLDEVGDMGMVLQAKLLRVLEEHEVERVGGDSPIPVDARIVAATNRAIEDQVEAGEFREDLFFRLAVARIHLPPLRERMEDLEELVYHFAREFGRKHGAPVRGISRQALARLHEHDWPGNVRELRNVIERGVLGGRDGRIRVEDLRVGDDAPNLSPTWSAAREVGYSPMSSMEEVEQDHIERVLAHTGGRIIRAAEILGMHRNTLSRKLARYGIGVPEDGTARAEGADVSSPVPSSEIQP